MSEPTFRVIDKFDRTLGALAGLPDVAHVKPATVQVLSPLIGEAQTITVQTFRQRERGDTIFLVCVGAEGSVRIALPPEVADVIARQRDALTAKNRRSAARAEAARRKAAGIKPGFLRVKGAKDKGEAKGA